MAKNYRSNLDLIRGSARIYLHAEARPAACLPSLLSLHMDCPGLQGETELMGRSVALSNWRAALDGSHFLDKVGVQKILTCYTTFFYSLLWLLNVCVFKIMIIRERNFMTW